MTSKWSQLGLTQVRYGNDMQREVYQFYLRLFRDGSESQPCSAQR